MIDVIHRQIKNILLHSGMISVIQKIGIGMELFNVFKVTFVGEKEAFWNLLIFSVLYTGGVATEEK